MKPMTTFKSILTGLALIVGSAVAHAGPITYTYQADNIDYTFVGAGFGFLPTNYYSIQANLSNGSWTNGTGTTTAYDPATDTLTRLDLTLNFATLSNKTFKLALGNVGNALQFTAQSNWSSLWNLGQSVVNLSEIDLTAYSMSDLLSAGILDIELGLTQAGMITLTSYSLTVSGMRTLQEAVPVSAPSSLMLLTLGLLGVRWHSRRQIRAASC